MAVDLMARSMAGSALTEIEKGGTTSKITLESQQLDPYAQVYTLKQGGELIGKINIPKDMVIEDGYSVTYTDPSQFPSDFPSGYGVGTYVVLVIANSDNTRIFIPMDIMGISTDADNQLRLGTDGKLYVGKTDLSNYYNKSEVNDLLDSKTPNSEFQEEVSRIDDELADRVKEEQFNILSEKVANIELFKFPNAIIYGEPTINNGQVSGFSTNNYLAFPFLVDFGERDFVIDMAFTTGSDVVTQQNIIDGKFGLAFAIQNGHFVLAISANGQSWDIGVIEGTYNVQPNTNYYLKLSFNKLQYKLSYSLDGKNYTNDITKVATQRPYPVQIYIGIGDLDTDSPKPFGGIINMNKSFVTVNSTIIWQGMDDVGLATRLATDLENIDNIGIDRIKEIVNETVDLTDYAKKNVNGDIETDSDNSIDRNANNIDKLWSNIKSMVSQADTIWDVSGYTFSYVGFDYIHDIQKNYKPNAQRLGQFVLDQSTGKVYQCVSQQITIPYGGTTTNYVWGVYEQLTKSAISGIKEDFNKKINEVNSDITEIKQVLSKDFVQTTYEQTETLTLQANEYRANIKVNTLNNHPTFVGEYFAVGVNGFMVSNEYIHITSMYTNSDGEVTLCVKNTSPNSIFSGRIRFYVSWVRTPFGQ